MITLPRSRLTGSAFAGLLALLSAANPARAQTPAFTPLQPSGIYATGEKAGWTASLPTGTAPPATGYAYTLRKNNTVTVATGTLDLIATPASLDTTLDEPAMLFASVTLPNGTKSVLGAAVAPAALQPSVPRPADFETFWQAKLDALATVPVNAVLTPADSGRAGVDYATLRLDNVGGAHVYGQVARPSRDGKFPAMLILQWAGVYGLQKSWVTDRAAEGWLALNVEPHDLPGDRPDSFYTNQPALIKNYHTIGNDDRDQNYFLQMYLGDCRALDYLASRSDWDGKVFLVTGGSMGGQQSLAVAGLRPATVTHVIVVEPAGCDTNGSLHGRTAGYPYWDTSKPAVTETSRYFDPVNFASRIQATCLVAMGFVDTVAPPVGIWIAYNQIPGLKEAVPLIAAPHNDTATYAQMKPYYDRSYAWTGALLAGTYPKINPAPVAPVLAWDPPIPTPAGTRLSAAQLNAHTSVPGVFSYAPTAGAVLAAGTQTLTATFTPLDTVNFATVATQASLEVTAAAPSFTAAPSSAAVADGTAVTLSATATPPPGSAGVTWEWQRNGTALANAAAAITLPAVRAADTGLYTAIATSGAASVSAAAIVGLTATTKTVGTATEVGSDIYVASNGNTFDQVLLEGPAAAITADYPANQITRISFVDLDDDIVQVEFSGPGTLSLLLESPSAPAPPAKYNQSVTYMKGHAGIVITGADEHSNVSVFTVGRATAVNQALFRNDVVYDGIADLAFLAISSPTGRFGGVRTANANYFAAKGIVGVYAPGVAFDGPVYIGNITTFDRASPMILLGTARDVRITGGDLAQDNHRAVRISGFTRLLFTAGSDSHGRALPARTNRGTLDLNGENVTSRIVVGP